METLNTALGLVSEKYIGRGLLPLFEHQHRENRIDELWVLHLVPRPPFESLHCGETFV
jgi:hypothetical protein